MLVREIMTAPVVAIDADESIGAAIQVMQSGGFRRLPVTKDNRLVGIITDRDLRLATNSPLVLREKWYNDFVLDSIKVKSCMTENPITVSPDTPLLDAVKVMRRKKFGGLPVVEDGVLVGIITETDLMDYLIQILEQKEVTA